MKTHDMYIDGNWSQSESGQTYDAINPAKGEAFARVAKGTRKDAQRAVAAANEWQWAEELNAGIVVPVEK